MSSFNRVILMGNLTRDPELKYLPNNTPVCELGLAVNHRWRDRDGNPREEVCFVDVSVFGRAGETVNQYMSKGRAILIEGRLKYDTWTAQDGTKRSKHSVIADNFTFVGPRDPAAGGASGAGERAGGRATGEAPASAPRAGNAAPRYADPAAEPLSDEPAPRRAEDIPF